MIFRSRRPTRSGLINVTPLIDVLFLMLIFVLVAAKFEAEGGIGVDLAKGKSRDTVTRNRVYTLVLTHDGTMFLEKEKVRLGALAAAIRKARSERTDPVLVIRADREVPWERIVGVTDIAKESGQSQVNFRIKP